MIVWKTPTSVVEQEKEIANIRTEKKEIKLSLFIVNIVYIENLQVIRIIVFSKVAW